MKRLMTASLVAVLLAGCASTPPGTPALSTPSTANYFETNYEGKTYVLGSIASLKKFNQDRRLADPVTNYYKGDPVVFETDDHFVQNRLIAEYEKQHK